MTLLPIREVEKPWGRSSLPPPFSAPPGKQIGEIWFEPPPQLRQLLVKYIFTSEALSVQVHPSDAQTEAAGLGRQGKEECWLVVSADREAQLGIGFERSLTADEMRAAALDGSIEHLLRWYPVRPGDFFYIPANTVHAIGAGIGLIEVQQNSDITYRLYDYGRPRELHLEQGMAVARGEPYADPRQCHVAKHGEVVLVDGPVFRLVRYDGPISPDLATKLDGSALLIIPQDGVVMVDGDEVTPGACALAERLAAIEIETNARGLIAQPV